ncbi:HNH endonuclease signature motif containing protein [Aeromonas simiae]|uniref:HNH endonuclease signature motif containing protein n=1 Tax=Aeromonas simiae TaxID=218936 RepID=UPI0039F193DE
MCAHCLRDGVYTPATVVDHIIPIDGDADVLFWPASNHQPLCASCHGRKTTTTDPETKRQRKAGRFRKQEEAALHRTSWIYEGGDDSA